MFYFDKNNQGVMFGNTRKETQTLCDGRVLEIKPDMNMDFRSMPFSDDTFNLVVFDPPHLISAGKKSWLRAKYGVLSESWEGDIKLGFQECFRVLKVNGILIFKWSETQIKVSQILKLTDHKPLFGHHSGKKGGTHWFTFMKY